MAVMGQEKILSFSQLDVLFRIAGALWKHADVIFRDDDPSLYGEGDHQKLHSQLGVAKVLIMWRICANDPAMRSMSATSIGRSFGFPTKTHLKDLIRQRLVEEDKEGTDGRRKLLKLTNKGQMTMDRLMKTWSQESDSMFTQSNVVRMKAFTDGLREVSSLPEELLQTYRDA